MSALAEMDDAGFACLDSAQASVRRIRLRTGLQLAQKSLSACLDLANQPRQAMCGDGAPLGNQAIGLTGGDQKRVVDDRAVFAIERNTECEQQLLLGLDLVLQWLEQLGVGLGQGLFSVSTMPDGIEQPETAHRLSECGE